MSKMKMRPHTGVASTGTEKVEAPMTVRKICFLRIKKPTHLRTTISSVQTLESRQNKRYSHTDIAKLQLEQTGITNLLWYVRLIDNVNVIIGNRANNTNITIYPSNNQTKGWSQGSQSNVKCLLKACWTYSPLQPTCCTKGNKKKMHVLVHSTGAVLGRQNTSPNNLPPNMAANDLRCSEMLHYCRVVICV